ncbi:MAG TPA: acetyltransferase [Hanamia sp.]|nr:acetyltransferase [Hanamia sp.]
MKNNFCIYGASGHSKVIIEILERSDCFIKGLYDDDPAKKLLFEYSVSNEKSFLQLSGLTWIIGIGNNETRKKVAENNLLNFGSVIDKGAIISKRINLGKGTVIMPGVTVNSSAIIGDHVIVNTNASVDHDCILEDYVHVSPNVTLCGGITIGEGTHIGAGTVIIPGIKIGKWAKIGAGSVIIKDVPDYVTIAGNPGRIIKLHNKQ